MPQKQFFSETELTTLAREVRTKSGLSPAETARRLNVSRSVIFHAENSPEKSLLRVRIQMIETLGGMQVEGPLFRVRSAHNRKAGA